MPIGIGEYNNRPRKTMQQSGSSTILKAIG